MYNASAAFHSAVLANSPIERALFSFADGTILTNEDIHASTGVKIIESMNTEEELTIGLCPSSELSTTIMNYHGLLSGYVFGEAVVSFGARIATAARVNSGENCAAIFRFGSNPITFTGHSEVPYLRIDGMATTAQPSFAVHAIYMVGAIITCIGVDGSYWSATWADGVAWNTLEDDTWVSLETTTWDELGGGLVVYASTFNTFMVNKFIGWAAQGVGIWSNSNMWYEFTDTTSDTFELVPMGTFILDKPVKSKIKLLAITALDRMKKFDIDVTAWLAGLTYPITLGDMFISLCAHVGVANATTTFTNSTKSYSEAPAAFDGVTGREILKLIAEAACSYARMTRDGEVELAWFGTESVTIPMTSYFSIDVADYEVAVIDKLQISAVENDVGVIIGTGTNGYQILDNPFLYGVDDTAIRTLGTPIYNRLHAFAAFCPISAVALCDWSIQAGDIISITLNTVTFSFPVYRQTITWNGCARVIYESTGAELRPVINAVNRRVYSQNRSMYVLETTVSGLSSVVSTKVGDDEIISKINQSAEEISIEAAKISLNGYISGNNGTFSIDENGHMRAAGGTFGAFSADADGALMGNKPLTIGDMTIAGKTITGVKINRLNLDYIDFDGVGEVYPMGVTPDGDLVIFNLAIVNGALVATAPNSAPPSANVADVVQITTDGDGLAQRSSADINSSIVGYAAVNEVYRVDSQSTVSGFVWIYTTVKYMWNWDLNHWYPTTISGRYMRQKNTAQTIDYYNFGQVEYYPS